MMKSKAMSNIKRRIEKVEDKIQSMKEGADNREAKLLEIQRLKKDNPVKALLLQMELEYGRKCTFIDLALAAHGRLPKDSRRV